MNNTKICFPSTGKNLESNIDVRFGRCNYFVIVDVKDKKLLSFQAIENVGFSQGSGAGMSAAEQIGKLGVQVVIAEEVGPKAQSVLEQLGIDIVNDDGIIKDALDRYFKNI